MIAVLRDIYSLLF